MHLNHAYPEENVQELFRGKIRFTLLIKSKDYKWWQVKAQTSG